MIRVDQQEIARSSLEYGVELVPGTIIECDDLEEAQTFSATCGGEINVRHVYETAWAELA